MVYDTGKTMTITVDSEVIFNGIKISIYQKGCPFF